MTGGHAAPLQSTRAVSNLQRSESPITATEPAAGYHSNGADPPPAALPPSPGPPSVLEASGEASRAVLQFQQLMSSFLETQKQVMLAYLTGQSAGGPFEVPRIPDIRDEERLAAILSSPSAASVSSVVNPPQAASPATRRTVEDGDLTSLLMSIVSDRTGYPTELLGLDLDVEADLGIDSIKRVEIVGEFGRRLQDSHGVELRHVMAELTSAKTLRAIADRARAVVAAGADVCDCRVEPIDDQSTAPCLCQRAPRCSPIPDGDEGCATAGPRQSSGTRRSRRHHRRWPGCRRACRHGASRAWSVRRPSGTSRTWPGRRRRRARSSGRPSRERSSRFCSSAVRAQDFWSPSPAPSQACRGPCRDRGAA